MRWFIGIIAVLVVALIIQSGLLAYAAYVLLGVLLLTRLMTREGLHHVEAERNVSAEEVEAGDRIAVEVTVRNDGRLPLPWVLLEDQLPAFALRQRPPRLRGQRQTVAIPAAAAGQETTLRYKVDCTNRGFYQIGPLVLESGDLFGLHRRYRVVAPPAYVMVYPRVVPLLGYDIASRRPIGDVRLVHRLYEDPTRIAGVRPYQPGDPLNRIHWRATARAGRLHSKIYDPSTLAGATLLLDFHNAGYPSRGEPNRSDLAATAAASLAHAISQTRPAGRTRDQCRRRGRAALRDELSRSAEASRQRSGLSPAGPSGEGGQSTAAGGAPSAADRANGSRRRAVPAHP